MSSEPSKATKPFTVAIIGGGLGGVALAIGLMNNSVPFHIYEASPCFGEIGAGVSFGPNATRALSALSPSLLEIYNRHASTNETPGMSDTFLSIRRGEVGDDDSRGEGKGQAPGDLLFHLGEGFRRNCVHRAQFLDDIVKLLPPGSASFKKALVAIEDPNEDGVREDKLLKFADGSTATASIVVGCDGIHSKTRLHLHGPSAHPTFSGAHSFRALVPRAVAEDVLGPDAAVNGNLYIGQGRYIITYPVARGALINMNAIAYRPGSSWTHDTWIDPGHREDMLADFRGWHPGLVELLSRHSPGEKWGMFDYEHTKSYVRGRVCLLGDAAHATTPHMGAGAGMAFEDAAVLSRLLGETARPEDVVKALELYDSLRRPRSQQLVRFSKLNGLAFAMLEDGIGSDLELMEKEMTKRFHWLWEGDFEGLLD